MKKRFWLLALLITALITACPSPPPAITDGVWGESNWGQANWR
jgi:hypothetical protein